MKIMKEKGKLIVKGKERVIVQKMKSQKGVLLDNEKGKKNYQGKMMFDERVINYRGQWIDIELD